MATLFGFPWHGLVTGGGRLRRRRSGQVRRPRLLGIDVLEDRCVPSLTPADGGRLVYDDDAVDVVQDGKKGAAGIYWLADANLAATKPFGVKGINPDGSMTWEAALHWATWAGHVEVVWILVMEGRADVNAKNRSDETALHLAAEKGHIEIVRFLVMEGADVNTKNKNDVTVLHLAARGGHTEVVRFLVGEGRADVNAKDSDRNTALILASKKRAH